MRILSIETSCDETAVSVIEAEGSIQNPSYTVISSSLFSQSDMHALYGGVLPNLARRAHAEKIIPLVVQTLEKANALHTETQVAVENSQHENKLHEVEAILEKEPVVFDSVQMYELETRIPAIDAVAVTEGPGLEPALWVGISTARALAHLWNKPLIPTNHMEGHILSPLITKQPAPVTFPALAVLISGGHTELVHVHSFGSYHIIGKTRDDAIGEAFDKVARLLDLPYPGGPQVSALAQAARDEHIIPKNHGITLPRPMIQSKDMDFSFSGLKTAVYILYDHSQKIRQSHFLIYKKKLLQENLKMLLLTFFIQKLKQHAIFNRTLPYLSEAALLQTLAYEKQC